MTRHPELLLPAGSPEVLRTAVHYGADAVYIGGEAFGLRAAAHNFSGGEMRDAVAYAHKYGVRVHVTANIFAHNRDLAGAEQYFEELRAIGPDAILVADPGMFSLAKRICPDIEIHISTQANTTNLESVRFWGGLGASRVVLARELSLPEIREIRNGLRQRPQNETTVQDGHAGSGVPEIETFVHGAMCISYSGRCLLSNYFTGRDANQGACTHPCRWQYAVMEESRPGEYLPVEENERGTYIFNSRDLCMVDHLPDLYAAGIDSFKIEGRMKNALYVAVCARTYRLAMADYEADPERYEARLPWYRKQIGGCTYRPFSTGFFYGKPGAESQIYDSNTYEKPYTYLGYAEDVAEISGVNPGQEPPAPAASPVRGRQIVLTLTQKNKFSVGERIEIMKPDGRDLSAEIQSIRDEEGHLMESAPHPQQRVRVTVRLEDSFPDGSGECGLPETLDVIRRAE